MSNVRSVGYIGMGIMGVAMARNLVKAGFDVTVWNRTRSKCDALASDGAKVADSPSALAAAGPDVICTNVTDTPDVEEVLFGDDGVEKSAQSGLIVVDNSTISPVRTQQFASRLADKGVLYLDAPVSGGDIGAQNGTLSIMVGGDAGAFERCLPLFEAMGKSIMHLGPAGMGQVCKACNQIAVSCNLIGVCEALALARKSGLDMGKMIEVVSGGAGGSWQLANLGAKVASGDHAPGFMIDLVLKDLSLVADAARARQLPLSATSLAESYFRAAAADGGGRLGTQAMAKTLEGLGGFSYPDR
ncbi:MAG: 2-hydroxy-3-oxopropionate reductase [Phycisphaeraceae bacterium]|nr:2-hydroxy-3-oxopropionate reductase [Phycisphaeraceae bacterium]